MKNCQTCTWNEIAAKCRQGHIRDTQWSREIYAPIRPIPIENCHAWKEREDKDRGEIFRKLDVVLEYAARRRIGREWLNFLSDIEKFNIEFDDVKDLVDRYKL